MLDPSILQEASHLFVSGIHCEVVFTPRSTMSTDILDDCTYWESPRSLEVLSTVLIDCKEDTVERICEERASNASLSASAFVWPEPVPMITASAAKRGKQDIRIKSIIKKALFPRDIVYNPIFSNSASRNFIASSELKVVSVVDRELLVVFCASSKRTFCSNASVWSR